MRETRSVRRVTNRAGDAAFAEALTPSSPSHANWPTYDHFSEPIGSDEPSSTRTANTRMKNSPCSTTYAPQAINRPSGDHDGPNSDNSSGAFRGASFRSSEPSSLATIKAVSRCGGVWRTKAKYWPLG